MTHYLRLSLFLLLAATPGLTQGPTPSSPAPAAVVANKPSASAPAAKSSADDLQAVLAQMNQVAGNFTSAQGNFEFKTYQKVVDDLFVQKGSIYFRRTKKGVDAALHITSPDAKQVVFKDGKLIVYEPKINQITEPDISKNKESVESFLSLGFGARGDDLLKDYDVTMEGWENIDGVKTAKLALVAKNEKLRNAYNKIVLWIDPVKDVILQQQFFESAGNYRLAHYTNLKTNDKIPGDAFNLETRSHPKIVRPQ
jgi:outer membrane lipoprotein-sorting protein